jgi:hypothetical protein
MKINIKHNKVNKMKRIFLFITALIIASSSFANDEKPLVVPAGQAKNIVLGDNMKVTFINKASLKNEIKPDLVDLFEKLNIEVSNGNMRLELRPKSDKNERVYIIVEDLRSLTIGENTFVDTEDSLPGKQIKIVMADESYVRLLTNAEVKAYTFDGLSLDIQSKRFSSQKNKLVL